jgi:hypothetical protein
MMAGLAADVSVDMYMLLVFISKEEMIFLCLCQAVRFVIARRKRGGNPNSIAVGRSTAASVQGPGKKWPVGGFF